VRERCGCRARRPCTPDGRTPEAWSPGSRTSWRTNRTCAIPKSVKAHRIAENFDVFDVTLTPDEVAAVDALDTGLRSGPDPEVIRLDTFGTR
jgi:hypothetical protein